jgi:hypothetical protein
MTNTDLIITPEVWGPHGWKFIHYVTLAYPENPTPAQKEKYKAFLVLLKDVLPCSLCANHYAENLQKLPLSDEVLSSKENLIKWGIDIHNIVNESKNKPIIKYVEARRLIDTNVQCKAKVKEVVKDYDNTNTESYFENFANGESKDLVNKKPPATSKSNGSCSLDNMNIVYGMIGLLIALIFIAVVYKKK